MDWCIINFQFCNANFKADRNFQEIEDSLKVLDTKIEKKIKKNQNFL